MDGELPFNCRRWADPNWTKDLRPNGNDRRPEVGRGKRHLSDCTLDDFILGRMVTEFGSQGKISFAIVSFVLMT